MWGIIRPKGFLNAETRKELDALNKLFIREGFEKLPESWDLPWTTKGGQVYAIPARPRDLMWAPESFPPYKPHTSQQNHASRCMAYGVHAGTHGRDRGSSIPIRHDALHRDVQTVRQYTCTGSHQHHPYRRLWYTMPDDNPTHQIGWGWNRQGALPCYLNHSYIFISVIKRKPLAALCRMIFFPEKYISDTGDSNQTKLANKCGKMLHACLAKVIAEHLDTLFGLGINSEEYLFEGEHWMDPGPPVDLSPALVEWNGTPLRPHYPCDDVPPDITLLDITRGAWKPTSLILKASRASRR